MRRGRGGNGAEGLTGARGLHGNGAVGRAVRALTHGYGCEHTHSSIAAYRRRGRKMQFMGLAQPAPINNTFRSPWPQNVNTAQPRTFAYLEPSQLEACQLCASVCTLTSSQLRPSPAPPLARLRHAAISAVPGAARFTAGRGAEAERSAGSPRGTARPIPLSARPAAPSASPARPPPGGAAAPGREPAGRPCPALSPPRRSRSRPAAHAATAEPRGGCRQSGNRVFISQK